ncbi:prostaglandin E receptor 2a (subtype EP2) [Pygocentrus nattereri]|uniref:Prostaglandin E2 receptor EP2 subtype n=1 Tax=Pygocentrus nattereri TaxID=42514 RepID=A0A3B4DXU4_PYGNA|nr:prostaglandin E receptor 2a (subtype EP2) [Pygocentrus nattereri]
MTKNNSCHWRPTVKPGGGSPEISALMFATGVLGNVLALVVLEFRRRHRRCTLFRVLVTALVVTDLAGTCMISPLVQVAHYLNTSLVGMGATDRNSRGPVCEYFGFTMTLFSLSTLALLLAMALERCIAISWPYEYGRRASARYGLAAVPTIYALSVAFCALPFAGFGDYVQYCPGTWCFIDMNPQAREDKVFAIIYATLLLAMVLLVVACNCLVVYQLVMMYRRRARKRGCAVVRGKDRRHFSLAEEVEHLILLVIMTVIFVICSLPLMIRVYINSSAEESEKSHETDLIALRFISVNSIIDPWVFIILSPSVLRFLWGTLCKASNRSTSYRTSLAKSSGRALELCQNNAITTEIINLNKSAQMI